MTEAELEQVEIRAADAYGVSDCGRVLAEDVPALVAEVRRLRSVIQEAEWAADHQHADGSIDAVCPWCCEPEYTGCHASDCVAFPPGAVLG